MKKNKTGYIPQSKIIIASRESRLAVIQSMTLMKYIEEQVPQTGASLLTMKTTGDRVLDRTLDQIGGKGLFVKELDQALLAGQADLAVHSLKDMPMQMEPALPILAYSKREDPRDVLVLPAGITEIPADLPIGSSSLRRQIQLKKLYPDREILPVRGNIQTRLRKLDEGQFGALVLAAAGLIRLGLEDRISRYFTLDEIIPAAGQGIIAVQGKIDRDFGWLKGYDDAGSRAAATAERAYVTALNGGCSSPVCAHAQLEGNQLRLRGLYYEESTGLVRTGVLTGEVFEARELGLRLAKALQEGVSV